jgi:hypothetical protein
MTTPVVIILVGCSLNEENKLGISIVPAQPLGTAFGFEDS